MYLAVQEEIDLFFSNKANEIDSYVYFYPKLSTCNEILNTNLGRFSKSNYSYNDCAKIVIFFLQFGFSGQLSEGGLQYSVGSIEHFN